MIPDVPGFPIPRTDEGKRVNHGRGGGVGDRGEKKLKTRPEMVGIRPMSEKRDR